MKKFTLILDNEGLENFVIDAPEGYLGIDHSKVKFLANMNHQFEKVSLFLNKYGFQMKGFLLVEENDKSDYFMLRNSKRNFESIEFEIVESKTFRKIQIYNPKFV